MPSGPTIERVRGGIDEERDAEILEFLASEWGLADDAARRRLSEAVCVALDGGRVRGVACAEPGRVALIGDRPFWIYRSFPGLGSALWDSLFTEAFAALAAGFADSGSAPVGLCVSVTDPEQIDRRPEAVWPGTELMLAGYLESNAQVRVRYFWDAAIGPGFPESPSVDETKTHTYPLDDRYRIHDLTESTDVGADDVVAFWVREGALSEEAARERVGEVRMVATAQGEGVAGVSTLYLQRNEQLRLDLWHYRTFVGAAHRRSNLAAQLIFANRDLAERRFVNGEDTRAPGVLFELENEGMRKYFNKALWLPADFTFIGESENGAHVRVHWFPGARVGPASGA